MAADTSKILVEDLTRAQAKTELGRLAKQLARLDLAYHAKDAPLVE
ncbi:MAG: hypothetical protein ACK5U4_20720 [Rhodospirillales bacterium]